MISCFTEHRMKAFVVNCIIFLIVLPGKAQKLKFSQAYGTDATIYLRSGRQTELDSMKKVIRKILHKNECIVVNQLVPNNAKGGQHSIYYVVNRKFDTLIEPDIYQQIEPISNYAYMALLPSVNYTKHWGMVTLDKQLLLPFKYGEIRPLYINYTPWVNQPLLNYFLINENTEYDYNHNLFGVYNLATKKIEVPPVYQDLSILNAQYLVAENHDNRKGIIDFKNSIKVPFHYRYLGSTDRICLSTEIPATDTLFQEGVIDINNQIVLPFKYYNLQSFKDSWVTYSDTQFDIDESMIFYKRFYNLYTGKSMAVDTSQIHVPPAPEDLRKIFAPLLKPENEFYNSPIYRFVQYTKITKTIPYWRNPNDEYDLVDTTYFIRDTLLGGHYLTIPPDSVDTYCMNPKNLYDSPIFYVLLDSIMPDTLYTPEEVLTIAANQFSHYLDNYVWEQLPRLTATAGFLILPYAPLMQLFQNQNKQTEYNFINQTLIPLFTDSNLYAQFRQWCNPVFKEAFQKMPEFYKVEFHNTAQYLRNYLVNYNKQKIQKFLEDNEPSFAYNNPYTNTPDERRKLSAFVDRMILKRHWLTVTQAQELFIPICDEILSWK